MESLPIDMPSLLNFFIASWWWFDILHLIWVQVNFNIIIGISRFEILTFYNCMICFQYSGNVKNDDFNSLSDYIWKCEKRNWNILQYVSFVTKSLCRICYFCCQSSIATTCYDIFEASKYYLLYLDFSSWLVVILHFVSYLAK